MKFLKYLVNGQEMSITQKYGLKGTGPYFLGYVLINGKRHGKYFGLVDPRRIYPCVEREHHPVPKKHLSRKQAS